MGEHMVTENRRGWGRNRYWKLSIFWRLRRTGPWQRGRLLDVSTSGVGLFIPQGALPEVGQEVEVRFLLNKHPLPYGVVRVESRQRVIGCRIASVQNRRGDARDYYTDAPISWRVGGKGLWRSGRLSDASASGLALVVHGSPARAGEEIELARRSTAQRVRCYVLRTEVRDDNRILLACRMVSPESCQAWLPPPLETQSSSRWPPGTIAVKHAA